MKLLLSIIAMFSIRRAASQCRQVCDAPKCCEIDQACSPKCCDYVCGEECTEIYCCEAFSCGYNCGTCSPKYCSHCDADDCGGEDCDPVEGCVGDICGWNCRTVCDPTPSPTRRETPRPTKRPTRRPTREATPDPTPEPSPSPTEQTMPEPTVSRGEEPTQQTTEPSQQTTLPSPVDAAVTQTNPTSSSSDTNNSCDDAEGPLVPGTIVTGSTLGATPDAVPACGTATAGTYPGVWYSVQGTGTMLTVATCTGTELDTDYENQLSVWQGTCAGLQCVAGHSDPSCGGSKVTWPTVNGQLYYVLVHGKTATPGTFGIQVVTSDGGDDSNGGDDSSGDTGGIGARTHLSSACLLLGTARFTLEW